MRRIRPLLLAVVIPAAPLAAQSPQRYELQGERGRGLQSRRKRPDRGGNGGTP